MAFDEQFEKVGGGPTGKSWWKEQRKRLEQEKERRKKSVLRNLPEDTIRRILEEE